MTKIPSSLCVSPLTLTFTESKRVSVSSLSGFLLTWILVKLKDSFAKWPYFLISPGKFLLSSLHHYWPVSKTPTLVPFSGTDTDLTVKAVTSTPWLTVFSWVSFLWGKLLTSISRKPSRLNHNALRPHPRTQCGNQTKHHLITPSKELGLVNYLVGS